MTFADLVAGEAIFLDANPFVYHFVADPEYGAACSQLLQRIENQEIAGADVHARSDRNGPPDHDRGSDQHLHLARVGDRAAAPDNIRPRCNNSRDSTRPSSESCKAAFRF